MLMQDNGHILKHITLVTSVRIPLQCNIMYSQVLGTRAWTSLGGGMFCSDDDGDGGAVDPLTSDKDVPTPLLDQVLIGSGSGPVGGTALANMTG